MSAPDPFVLISAERAYFRLEDLVRLHDRLKELREGNGHIASSCKGKYAGYVK